MARFQLTLGTLQRTEPIQQLLNVMRCLDATWIRRCVRLLRSKVLPDGSRPAGASDYSYAARKP